MATPEITSPALKKWFAEMPWREGFFAIAVHQPKRSPLSKIRVSSFAPDGLEKSIQKVANIFGALETHGLDFGRTCLVYRNALVHSERLPDGTCLVIFTARNEKSYDFNGLEALFKEFRALRTAI